MPKEDTCSRMKFKRIILPVLLATIWISLSEFLRNQVLFSRYWTDHYRSLGVTFPAEPINGAMWGVWSLLYAIAIFILSKRFSLTETFLLAWLTGFGMMWVVIGNLGVLPFPLLYFAVPLSLLEAWVASFICKKLS